MEYTSGAMIKLSASNYSIWKPMMEDIIYCKDLHNLIEGDSAKPSSMPDKEWVKMHRKTIGCITQCIEVSVRGRLLKIKLLQLESLRIESLRREDLLPSI